MLLSHVNNYCDSFIDILKTGVITPSSKTGKIGLSDVGKTWAKQHGVTDAELAECRDNIYFTAIPDTIDVLLRMPPCSFIFPPHILKNVETIINPIHDFGRRTGPDVEIFTTNSVRTINKRLANIREKRIAMIRDTDMTHTECDEYIKENNWRLNEVVIKRDISIHNAKYCTVRFGITDTEIVLLPSAATILFVNPVDTEKLAILMSVLPNLYRAEKYRPVGVAERAALRPVLRAARPLTEFEITMLLWSIRTSPLYPMVYSTMSVVLLDVARNFAPKITNFFTKKDITHSIRAIETNDEAFINECIIVSLMTFLERFVYDDQYGSDFVFAKKSKAGANPEVAPPSLPARASAADVALFTQIYAKIHDFGIGLMSFEQFLYNRPAMP